MNHAWVLTLKCKWLKHQMVCQNLRQVDQWVTVAIVPKNVWQRTLAYFTLELSPVDACVVCRWLPIFFGLQPALNTVEVNELNATSTFADLKQRIDLIELAIPAESALRDVVVLFLENSWLPLVSIILRRSRSGRCIAFNNFGIDLFNCGLVSLLDLWQLMCP